MSKQVEDIFNNIKLIPNYIAIKSKKYFPPIFDILKKELKVIGQRQEQNENADFFLGCSQNFSSKQPIKKKILKNKEKKNKKKLNAMP